MNDETQQVAPHVHQDLTVAQLERLHANLHPSRVATREGGGGRQLSYLEAYDVRATLIRIFGYGGFSLECVNYRTVHESQYRSEQGRDLWRIAVIATMKLTIHQTGAVYTESAAASQSGPDIGEVYDFAIKTAQSDALKRCATNLGTTFGLSLYNNGTTADVVSRVFAPGQHEIVEDLRAAAGSDEEAAEAARGRLQASLKTAPTPEEPAAEPAPAPAPRARRTPPKRAKPDPVAEAAAFAEQAVATKAAAAEQPAEAAS